MRRRALLALAAALGSSTACTMTRGSRVGFTVGGAAVSTLGAMIFRSATDHEERNLGDFVIVGPGAVMVVGGLALVALGLTAQEPAEAAPAPTPTMRWPEPAWAGSPGGPALAVPRAPLPEIATSAAVLRMAQQVRRREPRRLQRGGDHAHRDRRA